MEVKSLNVQVYIADVTALDDPILYNKYLAEVPAYRQAKVKECTEKSQQNLVLASGVLLQHGLRQAGYEPELELEYSEEGKPFFPGHPELAVSLARSGQRAMCAVAVAGGPVGCEIGCDLEEKTKEQIDALSAQNMTLEQWTKLESYAKATQTDMGSLFYGKAKVIPGFVFSQPDVEALYVYTICCRSKIPAENIHPVDLKKLG